MTCGCKSSKPTPQGHTFPSQDLPLQGPTAFPKSITNWDPGVQMHEPKGGGHFFSNNTSYLGGKQPMEAWLRNLDFCGKTSQ